MIKAFEPLADRSRETLPADTSSMMKALRVISPVLIYYIVNGIVFYAGVRVIDVMAGVDRAYAATFTIYSAYWSIAINILAMIIGVLAILPIILGEKIVITGSKVRGDWAVTSALLGVGAAVAINLAINILGINAGSGYENTQSTMFSLPLIWGILVYGLVTPFIEELIFRAAVFNRTCRNYNLTIAMIITPVIFGVYHGNLPQGIYGCVMGFLICWVYERFGGLLYPLLLHAAANISIYILMYIGNVGRVGQIIICIAAIVITAVAIWMLSHARIKEEVNEGKTL